LELEEKALFPPLNPLLDLLDLTLQQGNEKMVQWFSALLVLQAGKLELPWCDALVFVPAPLLKRGARGLWQGELCRFFHAPLAAETLEAGRVIYLIDWYQRSDDEYVPIMEELGIYTHTFHILALFGHS
jgi:hypothetical protein